MNIEDHFKIPELQEGEFYQVTKTSEEFGPGSSPIIQTTNYQTKEGVIKYLNKELEITTYKTISGEDCYSELQFYDNMFDYYGSGDWVYEIRFYVTSFDD